MAPISKQAADAWDRVLEAASALAERIGGGRYQPEVGKPILLGGPEVTIDCVGTGKSVHDALRLTRAKGTVLLVGMPGIPWGIDWTTIWHKELDVRGSYAYGTETWNGGRVRTFDLALKFLQQNAPNLAPMVGGKFRLEELREALATAIGLRSVDYIKTVFATGKE